MLLNGVHALNAASANWFSAAAIMLLEVERHLQGLATLQQSHPDGCALSGRSQSVLDGRKDGFFTRIATRAATILGQPLAFVVSALAIVVWAASGPFLHYSDTWQVIVNTATTVLTFLAVFLIQNSQNRDGAAMQAKLDEILRALDKARSEFVGIEHLTDAQICEIRDALEREIKGEDRVNRRRPEVRSRRYFRDIEPVRRRLKPCPSWAG